MTGKHPPDWSAADRRLTALLDALLLGAIIQNITRYKTEEYVLGKRMVDLDQSSSR